jgi:hypothetical protein
LFVSAYPYIPIPFPNPHFPNRIPFPPKDIETEIEMVFFRPFPSVSVRFHRYMQHAWLCMMAINEAMESLMRENQSFDFGKSFCMQLNTKVKNLAFRICCSKRFGILHSKGI